MGTKKTVGGGIPTVLYISSYFSYVLFGCELFHHILSAFLSVFSLFEDFLPPLLQRPIQIIAQVFFRMVS